MLPKPLLGTPRRSIEERERLKPPLTPYKYRLNAKQARRVDRSGDREYFASELFAGPGADLKKITTPAAVPPRASNEACDFTGAILLLSPSGDPDLSDAVEAYVDPTAVEDWRRRANDILCPPAVTGWTAPSPELDPEVLRFLEESVDEDDMEDIYIPNLESEADISFDEEDSSSSSEDSEETSECFDYDVWLAENVML